MNENVKSATSGFSQICPSTGNNCRLLVSFGSLSLETLSLYYCVKSVRIRSFSGPYFPAFRLNKKRYSVSLRIRSECGKIRTRKTSNMDTFHAVYPFNRGR